MVRLITTFDYFPPPFWMYMKCFFTFQLGTQAYELHPYTITPLKLGQILAILGDCQIEMIP